MISEHMFLAVLLISLIGNAYFVISDKESASLSQTPADEMTVPKTWTREAIRVLWGERKRMSMTPIHVISPPGMAGIQILFKNESASTTGSLKHRYSWALMMWALLEGHVKNGSHVIEASSGNTACSLGYMCRLLGLKFTAIVPDTIEDVKVRRIQNQGGFVIRVPIGERLIRAGKLAELTGGFFMNQFKNAFFAEEFHESGDSDLQSGNMMSEIVRQTGEVPDFFVHPAGTGGTLSSIGRYVKKYGLDTKIVLADTQFSVYFDYVLNGTFSSESGSHHWVAPGMAGIGYGAMGPARIAKTTSLDPAVIDRVLKIPDLASTAAMKVAREVGINGGTSTGVNFIAALHIGAELLKRDEEIGREFKIATILADSGKYYETTYLNRQWIKEKFAFHGGLKIYDCWVRVIRESWNTGSDPLKDGKLRCSRTK